MRYARNALFTLRRLSLFSATFALLMTTSGCSMPVLIDTSAPYQANLTAQCPIELPRLAGKTGNDFDDMLRRLVSMYSDCAARHNQLVFEIHQRQELKK